MNKYLKHFRTVSKHKKEVLKECWACGLIWQGIVHDMSKFGPTEFASSAKYFQGTRSPIEAEKEELGYSAAWLHHKGHNKHHWEYWTDFNDDGSIKCAKIPYTYVVEMVCDWVGAGKVYSKDNWTQKTPLEYYNKVRPGRHFNVETENLLIFFLNGIDRKGLKWFHEAARISLLRDLYADGVFKDSPRPFERIEGDDFETRMEFDEYRHWFEEE